MQRWGLGRPRGPRIARIAAPLMAAALALFAAAPAPAGAHGGAAVPATTVGPLLAPAIAASPPAEVDEVLSATPGVWPGSGWSYAYQWLDCDPLAPANCTPIPGANAPTYTVDAGDGGYALEVQVSADDGIGDSGVASSAPTATVAAQPGAPVAQSAPAIGAVTGGVPVSASSGTWSPAPSSLTTQWFSCTADLVTCAAVGAVGDPTYTPTAADIGHVLLFAVYATVGGLDSVLDVSAPSAPVAFPPPTVTITSPIGTLSYPSAGGVVAFYSCVAPPGMTVSSCNGPVPSGTPYALGASGTQPFTVTAVDADGQSVSASVTLTVGGPARVIGIPATPTTVPRTSAASPPAVITLRAPVDGASYLQGSKVLASFGCTPSVACAATQAAGAQRAQALASGDALDTATLGEHTVSIDDGVPGAAQTVTYTVTPLELSALGESVQRFRGGPTARRTTPAPLGTTFRFTTSGPATVTFTFARRAGGRQRGAACVAAARAPRRSAPCVRLLAAGSLTQSVGAGPHAIAFTGMLAHGHALEPGRYVVALTAQGTSAWAGAPPVSFPIVIGGALRFTIVGRRAREAAR